MIVLKLNIHTYKILNVLMLVVEIHQLLKMVFVLNHVIQKHIHSSKIMFVLQNVLENMLNHLNNLVMFVLMNVHMKFKKKNMYVYQVQEHVQITII